MDAKLGRVLVIDDNEQRGESLIRELANLGYEVAIAMTGDQAMHSLDSGSLDIVLLHMQMSHSNSYQVLHTLKTDQRTKDLPVVIITNVEDGEGIAKCLEIGAHDFLTAPYHPASLKVRLSRTLEQQELRRLIEKETLALVETEAALRTREKYERDIEIGRQIQASFLPSVLPTISGWEVAARFEPAREVAGDWYDVFLLPQINRLALVIADVCDKGVGAALFMALMRSLIRAFAQQPTSLRWLDAIDQDGSVLAGVSIEERRRALPTVGTNALKNAIEQTNNYIAKNHAQTGMFATTFFGLLDPVTGLLLYVNGGHEAPVLLDSANKIKARLKPTGMGVGMMQDAEYIIGNVQMERGDLLVAYTDGVVEARNPERRFFSEERLLKLLEDAPPSAAMLLDRVIEHVRAHIAEADQYDDVTLLAVRRKQAGEV
jgi:two-component system response regulator